MLRRPPFLAIAIALLACMISAQSKGAAPAAMVQASAPAQMEHISVTTVGSGPDVILIPGLSSPRAVWDGVLPDLAKKHRVHLVQISGFGGDDPRANAKPGIIDGVVSDIATYAERAKLKSPAIVGHSLGGLVAMKLAVAHPSTVGRLMVIDALPFFGTLMMPNATAAMIEPRAAQMRGMIAASPKPATPVTADPGGNMSITPEGRVKVANWSAPADMRVVAQAMYEDMVTDLRGDVGKITGKPFTVLYAAGAQGAAQVWEPAYAGSAAKLVAVPGSYHFIMVDQPAVLTRELTAFLSAK